MRIPAIRGIIDRRILVNYRVDPQVLSTKLPPPFRPQLVNGCGIAGICLIRLKHLRPKALPAFAGLSSENAAHRIAVEWDTNGQTRTGVYIPRRDTSSRLVALTGGRIFPGAHHHAKFDVKETADQFHVAMRSFDDSEHLSVDAHLASSLPDESTFRTVAEVSAFFEAGSLGYSPQFSTKRFDGLELRSFNWHVEPLSIEQVESSFFDNRDAFPEGSVAFDNALLMRNIDHEWHGRESLCCSAMDEALPQKS